MKWDIAGLLKNARQASGYSASEAAKLLENYDIQISAKTIYGYESGFSMPNADVFVALCCIYKCSNPMDMFADNSLTSSESEMLDGYRKLDSFGQESVNLVLDHELRRG